MAKEIKKQEVMEEVAQEETKAENAEEAMAEEPKKEGFWKKHKKGILTTLAAVIAFGVGAGVGYATTKKEPDEEDFDTIDSTADEVDE